MDAPLLVENGKEDLPPLPESSVSPYSSPPSSSLKRAASPTPLLPAFEPYCSSSPPLPRPPKKGRGLTESRSSPLYDPAVTFSARQRELKYPTPLPTSSTELISSPSFLARKTARPSLKRSLSNLSERAPLAALPVVELDVTGEPTLMGRSGRAAHVQLGPNRLISRVHVKAAYIPTEPPSPAKLEITCLGNNGIKVACQGSSWDLRMHDSFTSTMKDVDVMLDACDSRVLIRWPLVAKALGTPSETNSTRYSEQSPAIEGDYHITRSPMKGSPLRKRVRMQSPVSPSPQVGRMMTPQSPIAAIEVYADKQAQEDLPVDEVVDSTQPTQILTHLSATEFDDFASDADEENDPIIHSFGPFGANLQAKMEAFSTDPPRPSPEDATKPSDRNLPSPRRNPVDTHIEIKLAKPRISDVANHVVNQLAFSRLSSTPLSTLFSNLPSSLVQEATMTAESLRALVDASTCVGKVERQGKDAAGKKLEPEYYYLPEEDDDTNRRDAVVEGLGKPGLRSCRKQHKQYFWRKPK